MLIKGYRSIRDEIELHLDGRITVLLGANDHGKTNILAALQHLNPDAPFVEPDDLNWDSGGTFSDSPSIIGEFRFSPEEFTEVVEAHNSETLDELMNERIRELREAVTLCTNEVNDCEKDLALKTAALEELATDDSDSEADSSKRLQITEMKRALATARQNLNAAKQKSDHARFRWIYAEGERILRASQGDAEDPQATIEARATTLANEFTDLQSRLQLAESEAASAKSQLSEAEAGGDASVLAKAKSASTAADRRAAEIRQATLRAKNAALIASEAAAAWAKVRDQAGSAPKPIDRGFKPISAKSVDPTVRVSRIGKSALQISGATELKPEIVRRYAEEWLPRIELVEPIQKLPDSVRAGKINTDEMEFMRGIFLYAGIDQDEWNSIFEQTLTTKRRLREASEELNKKLRENWSQGEDLSFTLQHNSGKSQIELTITDPSVQSRDVTASKRSSGFTHFFALKTILFAREQESYANSFIWLFDEPGIYLHPRGQHDLIQALETLSRSNQIVYTTHSIFLINKNHPSRHRLVLRGSRGTELDKKPYSERWSSTVEALGLGLPGTILWASKIALVEGDSDPIFLGAVLQKLIEVGEVDIDINEFSAISTGDSKHTDALIRILSASNLRPTLLHIVDGDEGGKERAKAVSDILKSAGGRELILDTGLSIEDYLIAPDPYLIRATARYAAAIAKTDPAAAEEALLAIDREEGESLATWTRRAGQMVAGTSQPISPVGIAREYASLILSTEDTLNARDMTKAKGLAAKIKAALALPSKELDQHHIEAREDETGISLG